MPDFVVTPALLNRRSGPSLDDPVVEVLPRDRMITGSDQGNGWVRTVSSDGTTYAMSRYLQELTVPRAEAIGMMTYASVAAGASVNVPLTFPTGRFQGAPSVLCSLISFPPEEINIAVTQPNRDGALMRIHRTTEGAVRAYWHAIEGAS